VLSRLNLLQGRVAVDGQQVPDAGVDIGRGVLEGGVAVLVGVAGCGGVGDASAHPPGMVRKV